MRITIFDLGVITPPSLPNVATETVSDRGYSYTAFEKPALTLFLGFVGIREGDNEVTFANPNAGKISGITELKPTSREGVRVKLSAMARAKGAHAFVEMDADGLRIRVSFQSSPTQMIEVGEVDVTFAGVWPMIGRCSCVNLASFYSEIKKELEPFGSVMPHQSALRVISKVTEDLIRTKIWSIQAPDDIAADYVKDNLAADLFGIFFNAIGSHTATLKASPDIPDVLNLAYETSQDSLFTRVVKVRT